MKGLLSFIILVGLIMFMSNPDIDKHAKAIDYQYDKDNPVSGLIVGPNIIKRAVKFEDYHIFSITTFDGEIISVGAFGNVKVKNLDIKF